MGTRRGLMDCSECPLVRGKRYIPCYRWMDGKWERVEPEYYPDAFQFEVSDGVRRGDDKV